MLIILTAVEKVAINFLKENEQWHSTLTPADPQNISQKASLPPGFILPKLEADVKFDQSKPDSKVLITLLKKHGTAFPERLEPLFVNSLKRRRNVDFPAAFSAFCRTYKSNCSD